MISHDGKDCDIWLERKDSGNTESHKYEPWLRAAPFNPRKTPFIVVSGVGDDLGGNSKPSKTPIGTTARASNLNTARPVSNEKDGANQVQETAMEIAETEALSKSESQNTRIPLNEVITSNSKLSTFHTNPVDFDAQIQEIDVALGKYENCEKHVASNLFDTSHVPVDTSHVPANNAATLTPSLPTHTQTTQEHAPHVAETSPLPANSAATLLPSLPTHTQITQEHAPHVAETSPLPINRTLRTWKKLARDNTMNTETTQGPTAIKRSREEDLELLPELPTKKLQVSMEVGQQNTMAEAAQQPRQA